MARIRTIKPEFWSSEQVMECELRTRLFFIGLWNFCDDHGRHPASAKQLKALIFPGDDISVESIRGMLNELASNGLIRLYTVDEKEYLFVTGWTHQKIDKRQDAKFPAPPSICSAPFGERSPNGIDGKEGKGEDRERKDSSESSSSVAARTRDDDDHLLRDLKKAANGNLAGGCADVRPIRRIIDSGGATREDVLGYFRERIPKLVKPLQTFRASFLEPELRDFSEARRKAAVVAPEKPPLDVFVASDDTRWPSLSARYRDLRGRAPPKGARNPSGRGASGWYFPADLVTTLAPAEAAE